MNMESNIRTNNIFKSFMENKNFNIILLASINTVLLSILSLIKNTKFSEIICFTCNNLPPFLGVISISYIGFTTSIILLVLSLHIRTSRYALGIMIFVSMIGTFMSSYLVSYQILAKKNICDLCLASSCLFLMILIGLFIEAYNQKVI